jgi:two-component system sensor histidine kinase KdpD
MPVPLAGVVVATRLHLPSMVLPALAVATAALTAAIAARWCAERRMRSEVEAHERELAHTKRQILALVSHELRTPVTGVVGFSRTLSGRLDDLGHDTLRLFVDAIDEHANRLARLIDNVVVASRTPLVVVGGTCQLSRVLSKAVARAGMAGEEGRLQISMQGALGARIDEEAAIRILANLIDNAVKFGDTAATIYLDGCKRDGRVVLRVANAGPAIPLGLRSALYDPFVQRDTTDTRTADGLGLGLHVCRELVEAYGGSIDLVDHPRLIVFEISLPAAREARTEQAPPPDARRRAEAAPDPVAEPPTTVPHHPPPRERVG